MIPPLFPDVTAVNVDRNGVVPFLYVFQKTAAVIAVVVAEGDGVQMGQVDPKLRRILHEQTGFAHIQNHTEAVLFHVDGQAVFLL